MKERPILFKPEMVRAILAGRKTMTRRALKVQPLDILPMNVPDQWVTLREKEPEPHGDLTRCRFGVPGDRLWVREKFSPYLFRPGCWYWADGNTAEYDATAPKPSIHMKRNQSRILLEILSVRVERVTEITEQDAIAEGIPAFSPSPSKIPRMQFASLWDSINGEGSWDRDPFVWVVEFKMLDMLTEIG